MMHYEKEQEDFLGKGYSEAVKPLLSIIVPCYNEELALPLFYSALTETLEKLNEQLSFEILLIDDGSKDETMQIFRELANKDSRIRYLSFSRNFGKESAMYAGLKNAKGDYTVIMDADLQNSPEVLIEMYHTLLNQEEGYDSVATRRVTRKGEPAIRSFFARGFYRLVNRISKTEVVDGAQDFRMMTRKFTNAVLSMTEYNRFSKGIFGWVGFRTKWIEVENIKRVAGETKWSFWKLFVYSMEGITAFSTIPLAVASVVGFLFCIIAVIMAFAFAVKTWIWGDPVSGFPTLVCIILLVGGIQLFCVGILGQYLSKMYLETKKRPLYIVKETNDDRE